MVFKYNSTTGTYLVTEVNGDTINGGVFMGLGNAGTITGVDKGLGPNDILNFSDTLALKNGSNLN